MADLRKLAKYIRWVYQNCRKLNITFESCQMFSSVIQFAFDIDMFIIPHVLKVSNKEGDDIGLAIFTVFLLDTGETRGAIDLGGTSKKWFIRVVLTT